MGMGSTRKWWIADVDKRSPNPFNSQNHYGINEVNYSDANDANTHSLYDLIKPVLNLFSVIDHARHKPLLFDF